MMKRLAAICLGIGLAGAMACINGDSDNGPEDVEETGLQLTVDIQGKSDVAGMRYSISKCGMKYEPFIVEDRNLEDLVLPGMIPSFVDEPFDGDSEHLFADYFTVIEPGCYDVKVQPITKEGKASNDCREAVAKGVEVHKEKTTEILLVSQCKGEDVGGVDVVAGLNHPPKIKYVKHYPSKFLDCPVEGKTRVVLCATAKDPDKDPMKFVWEQLLGPDVTSGPKLVYSSSEKGIKKECVEYKFKRKSADYLFGLTVFDKFHDLTKGDWITAEEWFEKNGYGELKSRAKIKIPVYVDCKRGDKDYPLPPYGDGDGDGDWDGDSDGDGDGDWDGDSDGDGDWDGKF